MPFKPRNTVESYIPAPAPNLPGSDKMHYDRELRRIQAAIEKLNQAVREIQAHLDTL